MGFQFTARGIQIVASLSQHLKTLTSIVQMAVALRHGKLFCTSLFIAVVNFPSGVKLMCGQHTCERRCHRVQDHSSTPCSRKVDQTCDRGHKFKISCGSKISGCKKCVVEDKETRRRAKRDLEMESKRQERQDTYAKKLEELDDEIDLFRRSMKYETEREDQARSLTQKRAHLQNLKETKARVDAARAIPKNTKPPSSSNGGQQGSSSGAKGIPEPLLGVKKEWEVMKSGGDQNEALDKLMDLIGLESVKEEFISVKSSIDLKIRQGVSLSQERLSCSLLGNPGTGTSQCLTLTTSNLGTNTVQVKPRSHEFGQSF